MQFDIIWLILAILLCFLITMLPYNIHFTRFLLFMSSFLFYALANGKVPYTSFYCVCSLRTNRLKKSPWPWSWFHFKYMVIHLKGLAELWQSYSSLWFISSSIFPNCYFVPPLLHLKGHAPSRCYIPCFRYIYISQNKQKQLLE